MRKVLLRFVFGDYWAFHAAGNEFLIGIGWLLIVWFLVAAVALAINWKITRDLKQVRSASLVWLVIPAALIAIPLLNLPLANSGIPVFGYGFMMFVGFSTATLLAARRVQTVGMSADVIWDLMLWVLVPGLVGARIIYLSQNWDRVMADKAGAQKLVALFALWDGGIVFYGCIIGAGLGLLAYCRLRRVDPLVLCDVIMPSVFVGEGFGRIGCFLYGCCFGDPCSLPWAVQFPRDSLTFEKLVERGTIPPDALSTIPLHPTQLYSSAAAFALAGALAWLFRRRSFDGQVLAMAWILYPINRYILEVFRDDEPGRLGLPQTFSQQVSVALLITGVAALIWFSRKNRLTSKSAPRKAESTPRKTEGSTPAV